MSKGNAFENVWVFLFRNSDYFVFLQKIGIRKIYETKTVSVMVLARLLIRTGTRPDVAVLNDINRWLEFHLT